MKKTIGKLLKKITVIDAIFFIIFIIALLAFVIIFRRETTYIALRLKVTDPDVQSLNDPPLNEYAYSFIKGDKEINGIGETTSEISSVDTYKIDPNKQVTYVDMRVKAVYSPQQKQYTVQGKPVAFGQSLTFTLSKVKFEGIVVDFPGFADSPVKSAKKIVQAQLRYDSRSYSDIYGVPLYLAQAVKVGDEVKDSQGNVLAKILKIDVLPAKRTIVTNTGNSTTIDDQELKDVFYTVEITTFKKNGLIYMFDYLPIYIGQTLPLNFPSISVWPTIISMD